jgi:uncharacterized protein involved in exopolysaccharide biosynthesis
MNLGLFLLIIRSRYLLVLFTLVLSVATVTILSIFAPNQYVAETSVVLNLNREIPLEQLGRPGQISSSYMNTQVDIINSRNVAKRVMGNMQMADDPGWQNAFQESESAGSIEDWIIAVLLQNLFVELPRDSRVIRIGYRAYNPEYAADLANAFAQAYVQASLELSMEPARLSAEWFDAQLKVLRKRLEDAQARVTDYQKEKGIVTEDERLGNETARLNELTKKYVAAQAEAYDVKSRQLGENHPEYVRAIKQEKALRYSIEQQKKSILDLKQKRDELDILLREVENERENYESTLRSYYQTRLESQFNQTNISILNPARPPTIQDSPNVVLNILSSIFLGLMCGLSLAVGVEMMNRRIRTKSDVDKILGVKLLATV